jgi:ADP-ribose 1''-phosphate phosphatase
MMLEYRKGDLFDVPQRTEIGSKMYLAHACNARGVWSAGVALEMARRYPDEFMKFNYHCSFYDNERALVGLCLIFGQVASLVTSKDYGNRVDPPEMILEATHKAFTNLVARIDQYDEIHMPKINSGLFRVPWENTADVLENVLQLADKPIKVVIWELTK